ncbi:MAG: DUF883 family protein [Phycisphaerales bacterium]|nr:MAG: DUF883 family protein [Phycisphaerales bacterium]
MSRTQFNDSTATHQEFDKAADGVEKVKGDLKNLKHDVADVARSGASEVRQGMHDAVEAGKETYQGAKDMAREGYEGTKQAACDATSSLRDVVSDHPIASVSIAAGAGVLLGGLLLWRLRS